MDSLLFCPTSSNFLSHWNAIIFPQSPTTEGSFSPTTSGLFPEDSHRQHKAIVLHLSLSYFFFNFLFNKLVIQELVISFPNICQFSKILLIIDFFLFKPLWLGKTLDVILILLNVLRLILWLSIWSVLEIILPAIEKNVFSHFWMECSVLWLLYLLCLKNFSTSVFCYSF